MTPENIPYYTRLDLPFYSGIIDGTYAELAGLYQLENYLSRLNGLSKDIVNFAQNFSDFVYAYTFAYLLCSTEQVKKSEGFYHKLTAKLEKENKTFSELVTYPYDQAQKKLLKMQLDQCEASKKLRKEVEELAEFITDVEELQKIVDSVSQEIKDYFETISGFDNVARYEHGRLVVPLLTTIVPVTKTTKLKDFVAGLRKISGKNLANHIKNWGKKEVSRLSWNGAKNIFKATDDEIAQATQRIKTHRTTNNLKGGNFGYLEGYVNGKKVDNKFWRSGKVGEGEPQIFKAIEVEGRGGNSWLRNTDSEYKMLNQLAQDLGGKAGKTYPNITGEIKVIPEGNVSKLVIMIW